MRESLLWLSSTIPESIGIRFVDSGIWNDDEADMCISTDAALLDTMGGMSHPPLDLSLLDERVTHLRSNAIELGTWKGYSTGARDYIKFCNTHSLPLDPAP